MTQIKPGVIKLDSGLYYFSPSYLVRRLGELGVSKDEAAAIVGSFVSEAVDAEQLFTLRTLARPQ